MEAVLGPDSCVQLYPDIVPSASVPEPVSVIEDVGSVIVCGLPALATGSWFPGGGNSTGPPCGLNSIQFRFHPPFACDVYMRSVCCPAGRETVADTVVQNWKFPV